MLRKEIIENIQELKLDVNPEYVDVPKHMRPAHSELVAVRFSVAAYRFLDNYHEFSQQDKEKISSYLKRKIQHDLSVPISPVYVAIHFLSHLYCDNQKLDNQREEVLNGLLDYIGAGRP